MFAHMEEEKVKVNFILLVLQPPAALIQTFVFGIAAPF